MIDSKSLYDLLVEEQCDLFCGVPDSLLTSLSACVLDNAPANRSIITANEGGAVGIACGWHMATGRYGVVYMQNSGQGNTVNPLLSIADPEVYSIPMLLVIGWRGEPGVHDEPQHVKQGKLTLPLLETMDIPYEVLDENGWEAQLRSLLADMKEKSRPVALVIRKGSLAPYPHDVSNSDHEILREEALELILAALDDGDLVVSTTGKESREVFEIRERHGQGHSHDFLTVGGMGHTASIAFGLALGAPERRVWCLDGDGSMLMHLGSLPVMAQVWPDNLRYVVNVNSAHESVGGQPNVAGDIDIQAALKAFGMGDSVEASSKEEVEAGMESLKSGVAKTLLVYTRQGSRDDLGRPTASPQENKEALMREIGSWERNA